MKLADLPNTHGLVISVFFGRLLMVRNVRIDVFPVAIHGLAFLFSAGLSLLLGCDSGLVSNRDAESSARSTAVDSKQTSQSASSSNAIGGGSGFEDGDASAAKKPTKDRSTTNGGFPKLPDIPKEDQSPTSLQVEHQERATSSVTDQAPKTPAGSYLVGRPPNVDPARIKLAGIRQIRGKHLVLFTDLPSKPEIDVLPKIFDAAIEPWCRFFHIDPKRVENWQIHGYLMSERVKFEATGLYPAGLPDFPHGFQRGWELWWYDQPSDYYCRHLLLHEGTHAFMAHFLGGTGPPWYMEGMAELLSLHRWQQDRLQLRAFPATRDEVPFWGRVKVIRDSVAGGTTKSLASVFAFGVSAHRRVEAYAWSWAACLFLSEHPTYREAFAELPQQVRQLGRFSTSQAEAFSTIDVELENDWQAFLTDLDYGFRMSGALVQRRKGMPLPIDGATIEVDSQLGWQSSGYRLSAGVNYRITASGEFQIRKGPNAWVCQPDGITIHYYRGIPLGKLLGAVDSSTKGSGRPSVFLAPQHVGSELIFRSKHNGTLFFRVNEPAGELSDNDGKITVRIEPQS